MRVPETVAEAIELKLGGRGVLGRRIASDADLVAVVTAGIPIESLVAIRKAGFSDREIDRFVIPSRTRRHREARKESLTVNQSDRLVRMARIQAIAEDVFGDPDKANRWLREPLGILGRNTPLEFVSTEAGGRIVEEILAKIDWGAAA